MDITKTLLAAAMVLCGSSTTHAEILINEVMQSNVYSIMDDLNDFPDSWVELYNTSDDAVSLKGYKIGVKDKIKSAYPLTGLTILGKGTLLIYCDKVGEGRHTSFRVDSGKGGVYLFDADGNIVDQVTLAKQPAPDVAYGRESDGADKWGYQLTPTPGDHNTGGITETILGNVKFNTPGGVWSEAKTMDITLSLPKNAPAGARIIYTTDGSEPTVSQSLIYESPVRIETSTVIRAKAVADGCISSPSVVQSYIFHGRDINLPVVSIAINNEYLYDDYIGILARGVIGELNENYRQNWRRPLNIEYFEGEGNEAVINQLGETRVHGGLSRTNRLKSLAVYANKRFGTKNFDYEFWHKDKPGIRANKSFILRNAGNDFDGCYMRDGLIQRVIGRNTEIDWQAYQPVVVYVNGEYYAMYAMRERSNDDYVAANYNGLEDIDMFENWDEHKAGNAEAADEFKDFVFGDHTFEEWSQYINVESYANLMAINYWVYNTDFPMNNVVLWRRTDGVDGRWQWIVKDCDYGLGIWNETNYVQSDYSTFMYMNAAPYVGFDIYQRLVRTDFREYFMNRLIVYMGDFLNARTFKQYMDEILDEAQKEMSVSHSRWGSSWSQLPYNLEFMRDWIDLRESYMAAVMQDSWGLGLPVKVRVNTALNNEDLSGVNISYNDVSLTTGIFNGYDYIGRTVTLTGPEDKVSGWTVNIDGQKHTSAGNTLALTIDSQSDIDIEAILMSKTIDIDAPDATIKVVEGTIYASGTIEAYDTLGRMVKCGTDVLTLPARGIYIIKAGTQTAKCLW